MGALALVGVWFLAGDHSRAQSIDNSTYAASPPFITNAVPPNVLLLMDNSGSMNEAAYKPQAFDPTKTYYGLYDPLECYDYGSEKFIPNPAANPATPGTCTNAPYLWSGNLLNYATMRRVDIVKWVMIGGTCSVGGRDAMGGCRQLIGQATFATGACCLDQTMSVSYAHASGRVPSSYLPGAGGTLYFHLVGSSGSLKGSFCLDDDAARPGSSSSSCSDTDSYVESGPWRIRIDRFDNATGVIQEIGNKARFGLMEFNTDQGGKVLSDVGGNLQDLITAIEATTPSTWTPLAESLYEAARYFAQIRPFYYNSDYPYTVTNRDPYYFTSPKWAGTAQYVSCCKSFVIIFTDGEPTQDLAIPSALQDYAHSLHGAHCTSAVPNDPCTPHKENYGSNGSHFLDDVAYWAHTTDLRQSRIPVISESGKDLPGNQTLIIYSFYAFGQAIGREILQTTAKAGGFEDRNGNNLPDLPEEWDRYHNYTGEEGPDGLPDTYFESANADDLREKLLATIASILQRSTSGTSLAVLATSTTGEGALYQSFFYPRISEGLTSVDWVGYTQAFFLDTFGNLREDTNGDGRLVYKDDLIVKTRYEAGTGEVKADLYRDTSPSPDGDGKADDPSSPTATVGLRDLRPIWEAGRRLALRDESTNPRKILTWVDLDADGIVDSGEQIEFTSSSPDNRATLRPYLRAADTTEADKMIRWIRGEAIAGYRKRELTVSGSPRTWKYGDTIHSTPTVVGAPRERTDILYGDTSYSDFFKTYRTRRQVAYVGGNDGMLHAFNVGFYNAGDDPSTTDKVEHGWFTTQRLTPPFVSHTPALGEELWAFIPQELLPQLKFLTQADYQHVYYVDGKPKITDARIFCDRSAGAPAPPNCVTGQGTGSSHPNGWGTILIGSFRLGGSCKNCNVGATDLTVTADFNYDGDTTDPGDTRKFRSAYFALDITDPELDPKLLWVFTDDNLGLSLGYPAVGRVRPATGDKTTNSDARWFMVVGSGPTGYDVGSVQTGRVYVVDLVKKATSNAVNTAFYTFPTIQTCGAAAPNSECSWIGNVVTVDTDLDYRTDVIYFGNVICNASTAPCNGSATPTWKGRFYRLTTGSATNPALGTETDPCGWGVGSGGCARTPSVLLDDFACAGACTGPEQVGPVSAAPNVAQDDANKIWVYWGTGRYFSVADKTNADVQHVFGVKDLVPTSGCTQTSATACEEKDLENVSKAEVCVIGTTTNSGTCSPTNQVTGVTGVDSFDSSSGSTNTIVGRIQSKDGWYTTLDDQDPATPTRERVLLQPTILGGLVLFPSFQPDDDLCSFSGSSFLYALYYKSGTAYKEPVIGTVSQGGNTNVARRQALGDPGMASGLQVHMGAQGSNQSGVGGGGCEGRLTANIQSSTGSITQLCMKTAGVPWSYYVSWTSQRES
jgi:type IV pilus assembly protein PilY1